MLRLLAMTAIALTGADHWTTYLCLRDPVAGWEVSEGNPLADWLFASAGLVPGLAIDSVITLCAVVFLLKARTLSGNAKIACLVFISATTGYAVANNFQAIGAMGLWPGLMGSELG